MSRRAASRLINGVLCLAVVISCSQLDDRSLTTDAQLRYLHGRIHEYRNTRGRVPSDLDSLCSVAAGGCGPSGINRMDSWKRPVHYSLSDVGYELRSAGPDGRMGTWDDLTLNSRGEQARLKRLRGCYRVSRGTWTRLDTSVAKLVSVDSVVLDTVMRKGTGTYRVTPSPLAYLTGESLWYPRGDTSIVVVWSTGFGGQQLELAQRNDSLVGRWSINSDTRANQFSGPVTLTRGSC